MNTINTGLTNRPADLNNDTAAPAGDEAARFDRAPAQPSGNRPAMRMMTDNSGDSTLTAVTWNLESGEANPKTLAQQATSLLDYGTDIIGFQEVDSQSWLNDINGALENASGNDFDAILGTSGKAGGSRGNDFLGISYNKDKLELMGEPQELDYINRDGRGRSPLVAQFRHKETGQEFLYVVNHLRRGNGEAREDEATALNQWAKQQDLPVINVGDFNWDFDVSDNAPEAGNRAMEKLLKDDVFKWIEPEVKTPTYKSDRYDSILDGITVANGAKDWGVIDSEIISKAPFNLPDNGENTDHIPVLATFALNPEANYTPPTPRPNPTPDPVVDPAPVVDPEPGVDPAPVVDPKPDNSSGLRISSILANPAGVDDGNEQITLRNTSREPIDLSQFEISDRHGDRVQLEGIVEPGKEFTFTLPEGSVALGNKGDDVMLKSLGGELLDEVSYTKSQAQSGQVVKFLEDIVDLDIASALPNPAGEDAGNEQVTIRNNGTGNVDLADFSLWDRIGDSAQLEGVIAPGEERTFTLPDGSVALGNKGDDILLKNSAGEVFDQVSYTKSQAQSGAVVDFIDDQD